MVDGAWLSINYPKILYCKTFSRIFPGISRREIGRCLLTSEFDCLGIKTIVEVLKGLGKWPADSAAEKIWA